MIKKYYLIFFYLINLITLIMGIGDWGLGIGDWGFGVWGVGA